MYQTSVHEIHTEIEETIEVNQKNILKKIGIKKHQAKYILKNYKELVKIKSYLVQTIL
jgi:hypothetical protein